MKALIWLVAIGVVILLWKKNVRQRNVQPPPAQRNALPQPTVRCAHCGVVLPESESLPGAQGHYCSTEHRQRAEASPRA